MSSITTWTRIEPRARTGNSSPGVDARLFDPLWSLARQWQLGEFQAEDGGTPVISRIRGTQAMLSWKLSGQLPQQGPIEGKKYDPLQFPLEVAVEQRAIDGLKAELMLPWAAESGAYFLAMLKAQSQSISGDYRSKFIDMFAFVEPDSTVGTAAGGFSAALAGRALDGRRLARALRSGSAAALAANAALGIASGDRAEVRQTLLDWLSWYDSFYGEPDRNAGDAWIPDRLEYAVSVGGQLSTSPEDALVLTSAEYADGHLDWSDFDINKTDEVTGPGNQAVAFVSTSIPAPITIPGTPATRFWEIEGQAVANNLVSTGASDLGQLLMIEYGSVYGNDWFVVPLDVPIGSLTRIDSMVVTDTFGVRTLLRPVGEQSPRPDWAMWQLNTLRRPGGERQALPQPNLFFLPPSVGTVHDGQPLEQILFMRDEMANVAWAVEQGLEGAMEAAVPGASRVGPTETTALPEAPAFAMPRYLLSSTVPENWIALLPAQRPGEQGRIVSRLVRGAVLEPNGSQVVRTARSQLLGPQGTSELFDEEVPREGVRISRRRRVTRWLDGTTTLWTGYRKHVGRGEGSSGLRFDTVDE